MKDRRFVQRLCRFEISCELCCIKRSPGFKRNLKVVIGVPLVALIPVTAMAINVAPPFDVERGAVIPSALGVELWNLHRQSGALQVDDWQIAPEDLQRADVALATEMAKAAIGRGLATMPHYYRQYMPARRRAERIIIINGFDQTDADMFPGHGLPADRWKRQLVTAFGGGCAFWYAAYLVDQGKLLLLHSPGGRDQRIVCNGPK